MQQMENLTQNKKTPDLERLLVCNNDMVHLVYRLRSAETTKSVGKLFQVIQHMEHRDITKRPFKTKFSLARRAMEVQKLAEDYRSGLSLRQLAAKYGIDRKTVALQLRKAGVILRLPRSNIQKGPLRS